MPIAVPHARTAVTPILSLLILDCGSASTVTDVNGGDSGSTFPVNIDGGDSGSSMVDGYDGDFLSLVTEYDGGTAFSTMVVGIDGDGEVAAGGTALLVIPLVSGSTKAVALQGSRTSVFVGSSGRTGVNSQ